MRFSTRINSGKQLVSHVLILGLVLSAAVVSLCFEFPVAVSCTMASILALILIYFLSFLKLFHGQPLEDEDYDIEFDMEYEHFASKTLPETLLISPSPVIGKVGAPINFTVSLRDLDDYKGYMDYKDTEIKVFWETTGSYISPHEQDGHVILNDENDFNSTISISSSVLGFYAVNIFFNVSDGNEIIYFNKGGDWMILVVERESESLKKAFSITLLVLILVSLFFMGLDTDLNIIINILKCPIGPVLGIICHCLLMPGLSYMLGIFFLPSVYERLGFLFAGCFPGGSHSNIWTSLFGGDIDLSVTMTFISNLCSLVTTPLWIYFLGTPMINPDFQMPYLQLILCLFSTTIPVLLGIFFKSKLPKKAEFIKKHVSKPFFLVGLLTLIIFGCIANSFFFYLCSWKHVVSGLSLATLGYIFGAGMAALSCQGRPKIIAISLETGMQNVGICYVAVNLALKSPYSEMAVLPMIAYLLMTTGAVYVSYGIYFAVSTMKGSSEGSRNVHIKDGQTNDETEGVEKGIELRKS